MKILQKLYDSKIISKNGKLHPAHKDYNRFKDIIEEIINETSFLSEEYSIEERIRCITLSISSVPVCKTCNCKVNYTRTDKNFKTYCSIKCSANHPDTVANRRNTSFKKYGVTHHLKNKTILDKQKKTNINRYGVENVSQTKENRKKAFETQVKKFNWWWNDKNKLEEEYKKFDGKVSELAKYHNIAASTIYYSLRNFPEIEKIEVERNLFSEAEKELSEFLNSMSITHKTGLRNIIAPQELDIYIPEFNIAIEYNGIYWHSDARHSKIDKNYHLNKTNSCKDKNIQLIHIFEDEWENKKEIVKSRLLNILGKNKTKIYAKDCTIKEVAVKDSKTFLESSHIQGNCASSIRLGLYYKNDLVSLMTFGVSRFNKNFDYELLRFCNCLNTSVVGGASKLFKYFIKTYNPGSVISYCDKKWSQGNLYEILGFEFLTDSPPNYKYFDGSLELKSRLKFQKHKLPRLLENFDSSLTESENMRNHGYFRIWDCGNSVWVYSNKSKV